MEELPTELCLEVVSQVATVEDLVKLGQVSRQWRERVKKGFENWLRMQRVGEQLSPFSRRELGWVRRHVDGWFYCVVGLGGHLWTDGVSW